MQDNKHNLRNSVLVNSRETVNRTEIANITFMQSVTVIECRTANIGKIQRKLSLIAKWTVMQYNQHNVRNSVLVNSTEIANMTFMQSVTVIERIPAFISGNSKKT